MAYDSGSNDGIFDGRGNHDTTLGVGEHRAIRNALSELEGSDHPTLRALSNKLKGSLTGAAARGETSEESEVEKADSLDRALANVRTGRERLNKHDLGDTSEGERLKKAQSRLEAEFMAQRSGAFSGTPEYIREEQRRIG